MLVYLHCLRECAFELQGEPCKLTGSHSKYFCSHPKKEDWEGKCFRHCSLYVSLYLLFFSISKLILRQNMTEHLIRPWKQVLMTEFVLQIKRKASMCTLITRSGRLRLMASLQSHVGRNLCSLEQATVLKVRSFVCSSSFRRKMLDILIGMANVLFFFCKKFNFLCLVNILLCAFDITHILL